LEHEWEWLLGTHAPVNLLRLGADVGCSIIGFAVLTGTPIAGAVIGHDNGRFTYAIIFSAVVMISSSFFLISSRIARVGIRLDKKC